MVEFLATNNEALKTQISMLSHTPLGPFPEKHTDVVTTSNEKQIENPNESDNDVEESSSEKRVKIEKNPLTPPEREAVREVEKEKPYVVPPSYNPFIPFSQRFV